MKDFPALHQIPDALKPWENLPQWVCFRFEKRADGKLTKPPINPHTGRNASTTDPKTWGTYAEAVTAAKRFNLPGIGIVLSGGLFGIDLDHATKEDGTPRAEAEDIIRAMSTYTEISPSGSGFHILAKGAFKPERNKTTFPDGFAVEAYSAGRYFTVTGNALLALPVEERTKEAASVCGKYLPMPSDAKERAQDPQDLDDLALLDMARKAKNGDRFSALYDSGDLAGYGGDHSTADLALVNLLCYWTNGDAQRIDQLFRQSALFDSMKEEKGKKKWDAIHSKGRTYGQATIEKALSGFTPYAKQTKDGLRIFQAKPDILKPQEKAPAPALDFYSAADLQNDTTPEPEFIIRDILPPGLTIFAASPKMGKSFMMLSAAAAIASGSPFWGKETKAGSVLYCDIESNRHRVRKRLQAMHITPPRGLFITHRTQQLDSGLIDQIKTFLESHPETRAVILDTLGRIKGSSKTRADAYTADSQILGPLQTFALEKGIAVVAVTHLRKANAYVRDMDPFEAITGSNAQFGVADAAWLITGKRTEAEKHFLCSGRDIEENIDWTIERQEDGSWILRGDSGAIEQDKARIAYDMSPLAEVIRENARPVWRVTMGELIAEIARKTGSVPFTEKKAACEVQSIEEQLLKFDHILHERPIGSGRKGRYHTFRKTDL